MKKLQPLFGFDVNYDDNGNVEINDVKQFPQESKNSQKLYDRLELLKIEDSGIIFPIMLKKWIITINPINYETIMDYFRISGIKKVIEENKSKLVGKTTFVKGAVQYEKKCKYPNLNIHFYEVVNEGGDEVINIFDMIEYCKIQYNIKRFTPKRISDLEKLVNTEELLRIPYLPVELIQFDEFGNILDFNLHKINSINLPF
jgi:hypothetical protein